MKLGERQARNAVKQFLSETKLPTSLFNVSCEADSAARQAGRKTELFPSLFDYEQIIPSGFRCFWKKQTSGFLQGDGIYSVDRSNKAIQDYPHPDM